MRRRQQSFTVQVVTSNAGNTGPSFAPETPRDGKVGRPWRLQLKASDPDQDPLAFYGLGLPAGMSLNRLTGLLAWTPQATGAEPRTVSFSVKVLDGRGGADELPLSLTRHTGGVFYWEILNNRDYRR